MGRTITPGFWWARHRDSGELTIVQVTPPSGDAPLAVMFIGNLNWPRLDEAAEWVEFLARIPEPQ